MGTVLTVLLDGVMVAVIGVAGQVIMSRMARHDKKEDQAEADKVETAKQVASIRTAVMLLMLDKIKHLGLRFIADGSITYEDRSLLHRMHDNYHNELGGNGDLDQIMEDIDRLPLKQR